MNAYFEREVVEYSLTALYKSIEDSNIIANSRDSSDKNHILIR